MALKYQAEVRMSKQYRASVSLVEYDTDADPPYPEGALTRRILAGSIDATECSPAELVGRLDSLKNHLVAQRELKDAMETRRQQLETYINNWLANNEL